MASGVTTLLWGSDCGPHMWMQCMPAAIMRFRGSLTSMLYDVGRIFVRHPSALHCRCMSGHLVVSWVCFVCSISHYLQGPAIATEIDFEPSVRCFLCCMILFSLRRVFLPKHCVANSSVLSWYIILGRRLQCRVVNGLQTTRGKNFVVKC